MSLKRKTKTVAGNQVVDNSLPIESLSCTSNDPNLNNASPDIVPTQLAVSLYMQTHGQEAIVYGTAENPTDNEIAGYLESQGITLAEGDTFLYVQLDNDLLPVNSKRLTYNGFSLIKVFEQQSYTIQSQSDLIPTPRERIGKIGDGFTRNVETGASGIITANNADSTDVAYIQTGTNEQFIGIKYKITVTTANQQNSNGIRLKIYPAGDGGIDDVDPIVNVITATSNGAHTHEFIGAAQAHWIVLYGNNTTLEVTDLQMVSVASATPHIIDVKIPTTATYTYEIISSTGLGDPGVTLTAQNDGVQTSGNLRLELYRPLHIIGVSTATVKVTAEYQNTINVGGAVQTVTASTSKNFYMRVEN
jgi:hypothetical protein